MSILSGLMGSGTFWVIVNSARERKRYIDAVWTLYEQVYAALGPLNVGSRDSLLEYNEWHLLMRPDGTVAAFALTKLVPSYGGKVGAIGSDGSTVAKDALKDYFRNMTRHAGYWAEASGATLALARKYNLPIICASYAPLLLPGKRVLPGSSPSSYRRNVSGVGEVEKVLIGRPPGIPVVFSEDGCTVSSALSGLGRTARVRERPDPLDIIEHYSANML